MKVFASVGTQKFPFDRLLKLVDAAAAASPEDSFFAQTGNSLYIPRSFPSKPFLQKEEFEEQIRSCDLLFVHSGVGTIITALKAGRKIVVLPRLAKYGEHVDDHQLQIAEAFAEKNLVLCCGEGDDALTLMRQAMAHSFAPYVSHRADMLSVINEYLATLQTGGNTHGY